MSCSPTSIVNVIASAALLLLAACSDFGYPTPSDAVCGVSGIGCRPECHAIAMPAAGNDANAVSYQIGPASCPGGTVSDARRDAERACHDRGLRLASSAPQLSEQSPVGPLPAAKAATFRCHG